MKDNTLLSVQYSEKNFDFSANHKLTSNFGTTRPPCTLYMA